MRRITIAGLSLVALLAATAFAASAASAEAPEFGRCVKQAGGKFANSGCSKIEAGKNKFEWVPGPGPNNKFSSTIKPLTVATLETVGGTKIVCKGETSGGEVANAKEVANVVADFTSCEAAGVTCQSGATAGEIVTKPLSGVIGFEKISTESAIKDKLAEELHGPGGAPLAEFTCGPFPVVVAGSVLHNIKANSMVNKTTEKFVAKKGKQKPDHFVPPSGKGEAKEHILESSTGGAPFEQAGQSITALVTFEEKIEASTIN